MNSLTYRALIPFLTFISLFLGTGFVAGSIVHMGEGINPWDLSLLAVGVILFIAGSVAQDVRLGSKRLKEEGIFLFLALSLVLSIGIGMASGGMQHFDDTPAYSALLIPLGMGTGFIAFILKERVLISKKEWLLLVPTTVMMMVMLSVLLRLAATVLPQSQQDDHHNDSSASSVSSSASSHDEVVPHK